MTTLCDMTLVDCSQPLWLWRCDHCYQEAWTPPETKQVRAMCKKAGRRKMAMDCSHLGDQVGETKLKKKGCGCGQAKTATVWECDLREYCAPFGNGRVTDGAITDCTVCKKYLED